MVSFTQNVAGEGVRAVLANGEDVFVAVGVTVASVTDTAITSASGPSSGHTATIAGSLIGEGAGIILGNGADDHDQQLFVLAGGEVKGHSSGAELHGSHITVNNAGSIIGDTVGCKLVGAGAASSVTNSGLIQGGSFGLTSSDSHYTALTILNSGIIEGQIVSFEGWGHHGANNIKNTGMMIGNIAFGDGNDTYDGRQGHVQGIVYGYGGNDTLLGGTEANSLDGGRGNDTLFGGKGDDAFIFWFAPTKSNVDTIRDFTHTRGNHDHLALNTSVFGGMSEGGLSAKAFHVGGNAISAENRIIYDQKHGDLYYDEDGSGSAAAVKFAHLDNHATLSSGDFLVV